MFVHIEAAEDDESYLTAVKVNLLKDPPAKPASTEPGVAGKMALRLLPYCRRGCEDCRKLAKPAATDAPDRPVLRRGKPVGRNEFPEDEKPPAPPPATKTATAKPSSGSASASASTPKKDDGDFTITNEDVQRAKVAGDDEQITRSREWAETFTQGLPNYVCQQITTRYMEQSRSSGWSH